MILVDERPLSPAYLPGRFPGRDKEISEIKEFFGDLSGESGKFVSITGSPGSGKTSIVAMISQHSSNAKKTRIKPVFVDCSFHHSPYKLLPPLNWAIGNPVPNTGYSFQKLWVSFNANYDRRTPIVLILDNFDRFMDNFNFLETLMDIGVHIITITRSGGDGRREISFEKYHKEDLIEILADRARESLRPGSWNEEVLEEISEFAVASGNARLAIRTLREAAIEADRSGDLKIKKEHIHPAIYRSSIEEGWEILSELKVNELLTLMAVVQLTDEVPTTGQIYRKYLHLAKEAGVNPLSERRVSGILNNLERRGVLLTVRVCRGARGITRIAKLTEGLSFLEPIIRDGKDLLLRFRV